MIHQLFQILFAVCVLCSLGVALADAQSSVNKTLREKSIEYAVIQAAKEVVNRSGKTDIPNIVEKSTQQILSDIGTHQKKENSRQNLEAYVKNSFDEDLDKILESVFQSLKLDGIPSVDDYANLKKKVKDVYRDEISGQKSAYMSSNFNNIFQSSRKKAVEGQLSALLLSSYPTQKDVEDLDSANWPEASLSKLKQDIMKNIQGNTTNLFEENQAVVNDRATSILSKIRDQAKKQHETLNKDISQHLVTREKIAQGIKDNLDQAVKEMKYKAEKGEKIYDIFSSVLKSVDQQAEKKERERFLGTTADFAFSFDESYIRNTISGNLQDHKFRDNSAKIFGQSLFSQYVTNIVNQYAAKVPDAEAGDLKQRLQKIISDDTSIKDKLKIAITNQLKAWPGFKMIRDNIAVSQVQAHFALVHDGAWAVPESTLKDMSGVDSIDRALALPFISRDSVPYQRNALLEETEEDLLTRVRKLLAEGERAWDRQLRIVKEQEPTIKTEMTQKHTDLQALHGDTEEEYWIKRYTDTVTDKWREQRVELLWRGVPTPPAYAAIKYSPLFGHTKDEIQKIVHSYFQSQERTLTLAQKERERQQQKERERQQQEERERQQKSTPTPDQTVAPLPTPSDTSTTVGQTSKPNSQKGVDGGDNQSVKNKEVGKRGDEDTPSQGGALQKLPWWVWPLLIALFLLLVILSVLVVVLYQRSRSAVRPVAPRPVYLRVKNLNESVHMFSTLVGQGPKTLTASEAVFMVGDSTITFQRA